MFSFLLLLSVLLNEKHRKFVYTEFPGHDIAADSLLSTKRAPERGISWPILFAYQYHDSANKISPETLKLHGNKAKTRQHQKT